MRVEKGMAYKSEEEENEWLDESHDYIKRKDNRESEHKENMYSGKVKYL